MHPPDAADEPHVLEPGRTIHGITVERIALPENLSPLVEDPGPGSDHHPFAQEGIPVLALMQFPYPEYHQRVESLELIDERGSAYDTLKLCDRA